MVPVTEKKENSVGSDLPSHETKPDFTGIKGMYMEENKNPRAQSATRRLPNAGFKASNLWLGGGAVAEGRALAFLPLLQIIVF